MDKIAVIDFGGQYAHLIANRIRRLGVFSEIIQPDVSPELLSGYCGIILSGGPNSVTDEGSPVVPEDIFSLHMPILGLCYGHHLVAKLLGGTLSKGEKREYGIARMDIRKDTALFKGLSQKQQIWMSHGDAVESLPDGFEILASTAGCKYAAIGNIRKNIYGLQFHPEVTHTPNGMTILDNFITICGCKKEWNPETFTHDITESILKTCEGKKVFLLVSGGVDSTVCFALLNKALGSDRVLGFHIDNGLMRQDESESVLSYLKSHGYDNLQIYDASADFLNALTGIANPEEKRKIIGNKFIEAKERAQFALNLNIEEWILAQGTIYPDTIESAGTIHADKIKTHHNRVDIILELIEKGLIIEPISQLYKDEVRQLGESLGVPHDMVWRHPFPGPGLGVRALCSDGKEDVIDTSVSEQIKKIAQPSGYNSCVLPVKSVGVQGDSRTYAHPVLLTGPQDWTLLEKVSTQITNTVRPVNRVVYGLAVQPDQAYSIIEAYLTKERLDKLRAVDHLVTTVLHETEEYKSIWQMPVVLLPLVNKHGDEYVVLRPIASQEAMTARFFPLKDTTLDKIIKGTKKIKGVGDIFLDVTHKPPGTIEWE
jgi:GMP synthase (glutamine-hydrolysing)